MLADPKPNLAPSAIIPTDVIDSLIHSATNAPSGDNLQPWRFSRRENALLVHHVGTRDTSLYNVEGLASCVAIGAAIENLAIAASTYGYRAEVESVAGAPDDVLAEINFFAGASGDPLAP